MEHVGDFYGIMTVAVCSSQKSFRFLHNLSLALASLAVSTTCFGRSRLFEDNLVYQLFFLVLILIRKYSYLRDYYDSYNQAQVYERKTQEQSALVSQLLPKHTYEKLKNQNIENRLELTDQFERATLLFADIKGFTAYSNKNSPAQVVRMLRQLFEEFDKLCLKYNVYKVYTIGDCYVVLGFTNCYQRDYLQEAKNVVSMGLAMVETIQKVRESLDFVELDMRIGVHTGTLIGGIIGTEIVRYDIYGPDVMVANKFEEYGRTGHIHISESTKEILDKDRKKSFNIVPNGVVKVEKLNAEYNGYILTKKKFEI
jgi:phospholipid-translocating ATPase